MVIQRTRVRQPPLTQKIEKIIRERIISGKYLPDSHLPSETELAVELNVSRPTLRDALSTLATQGMIIRRQGRGTFVTRNPHISYPLDRAIDPQKLIGEYCCQPSFEQVYCGLETVSAAMAKALQIRAEAPVLVSHEVFTADEEPMIFCVNTVAASLFNPGLAEQVSSTPRVLEPFLKFLERETGLRAEYYIASVSSVSARECRFYISLPMSDKTPVLEIDEVAYTVEGRPICHTYEYHPGNKMSVELIRRLPKK